MIAKISLFNVKSLENCIRTNPLISVTEENEVTNNPTEFFNSLIDVSPWTNFGLRQVSVLEPPPVLKPVLVIEQIQVLEPKPVTVSKRNSNRFLVLKGAVTGSNIHESSDRHFKHTVYVWCNVFSVWRSNVRHNNIIIVYRGVFISAQHADWCGNCARDVYLALIPLPSREIEMCSKKKYI